jgi:hypothetical protein
MNGTDRSLGQLNPHLAQSLSHAQAPYIPDMIDYRLDDTRGSGLLDAAPT